MIVQRITMLKDSDTWIEIQQKRRIKPLDSNVGFNTGKGHFDLGQSSTHVGPPKGKKTDIIDVAKVDTNDDLKNLSFRNVTQGGVMANKVFQERKNNAKFDS